MYSQTANLLHGHVEKTRKGQIVVIFGQHFSQEMENELSCDLLSPLETRATTQTSFLTQHKISCR